MILGQEATTRTGHWLALGLDPGQVVEWRYDVRDDAIDQYVHSHPSGLSPIRRHHCHQHSLVMAPC